MVERFLYTEDVGGSSPSSPTTTGSIAREGQAPGRFKPGPTTALSVMRATGTSSRALLHRSQIEVENDERAMLVPRSPWCLHKIRIDQTRRGSPGGGSRALGQRGEDAIHSFALQLSENVHAHRMARIVHLRVSGASRKNGRQRQDHRSRLDHLALHRPLCLTPQMLPRSCSARRFPSAKCTLGATPFVFCFRNRISRVRIPDPLAMVLIRSAGPGALRRLERSPTGGLSRSIATRFSRYHHLSSFGKAFC